MPVFFLFALLVVIGRAERVFLHLLPLEKWIDDFKRDRDPDGNISIWEDMQDAYKAYCGDRELPLATRKEVFKIVLMRSMMPDDHVLARIELEHLTVDDVRKILAAYPGDANPIDVIQTNQ